MNEIALRGMMREVEKHGVSTKETKAMTAGMRRILDSFTSPTERDDAMAVIMVMLRAQALCTYDENGSVYELTVEGALVATYLLIDAGHLAVKDSCDLSEESYARRVQALDQWIAEYHVKQPGAVLH